MLALTVMMVILEDNDSGGTLVDDDDIKLWLMTMIMFLEDDGCGIVDLLSSHSCIIIFLWHAFPDAVFPFFYNLSFFAVNFFLFPPLFSPSSSGNVSLMSLSITRMVDMCW